MSIDSIANLIRRVTIELVLRIIVNNNYVTLKFDLEVFVPFLCYFTRGTGDYSCPHLIGIGIL